MAKSVLTLLEFDGYQIPLRIYKEWRGTVRFSLGKKNAILRLPTLYGRKMVQSEIERLEQWLKKQIKKNPNIADRFIQKNYKTGDTLIVRGHIFTLNINSEKRATNSGIIDTKKYINIKLSDQLEAYQKTDVTQKLIIKTLSKFFKKEISQRVHEINDTYFKKEIKSIKLKNNQSNWGSCSTKKNINLSSRLLLAPKEVLDYVIVHELAHLIEMNHSSKFWAEVKKVMPNYKDQEDWLSKHGAGLNF